MVDLGAILQVVLLPLGFFIKLIAQAVNDALDLARAISVDLYPNLMNLKFFLETGMWKDFADGLKDTEENLKNMNGELADIMKQGVSLDELFKAGLFDPKLMKGMLEEIKEFGDGPIGDELMASLAAMIGQNITLVGQFIKKLRDEGVTIILTTQYLEEADELANRISIIDEGLVVAEGTPDELKSSIGGDVITLTFRSDDDAIKAQTIIENSDIEDNQIRVTVENGAEKIPNLLNQLVSKDINVQSVSANKPSLDDVFL